MLNVHIKLCNIYVETWCVYTSVWHVCSSGRIHKLTNGYPLGVGPVVGREGGEMLLFLLYSSEWPEISVTLTHYLHS